MPKNIIPANCPFRIDIKLKFERDDTDNKVLIEFMEGGESFEEAWAKAKQYVDNMIKVNSYCKGFTYHANSISNNAYIYQTSQRYLNEGEDKNEKT